MDGVVAIRSVLVGDGGVTGLVPAARIKAGPQALGTDLPAITLSKISGVDRNIPAPGSKRHVRQRVQVSVRARNYPEQQAILRAVRHAAADRLNPAVTALTAVTIHTDGAGPDLLDDDTSIWTGSQDFIVTYSETR